MRGRSASQRVRARRRRVVAAVAAAAVLIGLVTWAVARSTTTREHGATTPASTTSVAPSTTASGPATSTTAEASRGPTVTAARITSAELGLAATFDPATDSSRLWLTRDSRTWRSVTPPGVVVGSFEDVLALDPLHLWATSSDCAGGGVTVWRSSDGGHTWAGAPAGFHNCSAGSFAHLQFVDPLHGWIVLTSANGPVTSLEATTDGGATWRQADARLPEDGDVMFSTPTDGYLGANPAGQFAFGASALYVTHDAGRTWARVTIHLGDPGLPNPSWSVIYGVPTFVDASTGVLPITVASANIAAVEWWETTDGGASWHLHTPLTAAPGGIDASPEPTMSPLLSSVTGPHVWWVLARTSTGAHSSRTLDAGAHWSDTDDVQLSWPSPRWFGAANADVAWMLGNDLYATTDGGHTWTRIDPPA